MCESSGLIPSRQVSAKPTYRELTLETSDSALEQRKNGILWPLAGGAVNVEPGTRLGPYEVLSAIGAGGMGEVYKARDTRLERTVAIKVLPSHLSKNEEVRQRFEREAKTISQITHPHI